MANRKPIFDINNNDVGTFSKSENEGKLILDAMLSQSSNSRMVMFLSDLARNRLTGEIPRLLYWNEVLQYL